MRMVEDVVEKVNADIERMAQIEEEISSLHERIDRLAHERSQISSRLFEDRPREFGRRLLVYLKKRAAADDHFAFRYQDLIFLVDDWVSGTDAWYQQRFDSARGPKKAMLSGEFDPYA